MATVAQNQANELDQFSAGFTAKDTLSTTVNDSSNNSTHTTSKSASSSSNKIVVDTDAVNQTNKASNDKRLHVLLTERETLSARLHRVQRQIEAGMWRWNRHTM